MDKENDTNRDLIFEVEIIEESQYSDVKKMNFFRSKKFILILLIVLLLLLNLMQFFCHNDIDSVINKIFFNKNQEFQWLGVTAIIAIISFIFNSITTLLRNKADLVAKSRINWIQDVRKLMSIFLRDVHYYPFIFQQCNEKSKDDPTYDEDVKIVNELAAKIEEYQYLLLLNLSDNEDNLEINNCIKDCMKWIENMPTRWETQTKNGTNPESFSYEQIPTTNLLKVSRDYFKKEWEKAKRSQ